MDNKTVNKAIRQHIWPFLKENNFSEFTSRTCWRFKTNRVEVLNLQSFNPYMAERFKCTTFSFAINLGIFLLYIPTYSSMKKKDDKIFPKEFECHLRNSLNKKLVQKKLFREDIWYVDSMGVNLNEVIEDAQDVINKIGLPWFNEFNNNESVLDYLLTKEDYSSNGTFGIGNNPSPKRSLLLGFTAAALGDKKRAKLELENVIKSECFEYLHEFINLKLKSF